MSQIQTDCRATQYFHVVVLLDLALSVSVELHFVQHVEPLDYPSENLVEVVESQVLISH